MLDVSTTTAGPAALATAPARTYTLAVWHPTAAGWTPLASASSLWELRPWAASLRGRRWRGVAVAVRAEEGRPDDERTGETVVGENGDGS